MPVLIPIGYDQYVEARALECVRPPLPDEVENAYIHQGRTLKSVLVRADGRVHGSTYSPGIISNRVNTVLQCDHFIEIGFEWHVAANNVDSVRPIGGELPINDAPKANGFKSVIIKADGTVYGSCYASATLVKRAGGFLARDIVSLRRGHAQHVGLFDGVDIGDAEDESGGGK